LDGSSPPRPESARAAAGASAAGASAAAAGALAERVDRLARENAALFERLLAGERRFRGLARSAWRVQEAERRRLARELHDGLGQSLTALRIRLERLAALAEPEHPALAAPLAEAVEAAARALADTRRLSHLLRPRVLDDLGLVPALRWLARTVGEWAAFAVDFEHRGVGEERLDADAETLLFRVAQEALTNAVKHSGAAGASLRLERAGGRLRLAVRDRGRGFDPAADAPDAESSGLAGMHDRVELFGGRLAIDSAPGRGTAVTVELPLAAGAAEGGGAE
jgi:signal transduction histidine kinase